MVGKSLKYLVGMFLIVLLLSCAKLPEVPAGFGMEDIPLNNTVLSKCGDLVTVSSIPDSSWVLIWFQDKEGNISSVPYDTKTNMFGEKYRSLKRR